MKKNQKKDEEEEEKKRRLRLRGQLEEEEEEEEDWEPEALKCIAYTSDDTENFIVGATGQYNGFFYLCNFKNERPLKAFPIA